MVMSSVWNFCTRYSDVVFAATGKVTMSVYGAVTLGNVSSNLSRNFDAPLRQVARKVA